MRFILFLLLFISVTYGKINDKNFKEKINGGIVVTIFSAEWQDARSEEHTSELQSRLHLVCRLLLEKKKKKQETTKE